MPQRDYYHQAVRKALIRDGWTITHDPYMLSHGKRKLYVDLGAERLLGAERGSEKIAVEVKSFLGQSEVADLENALGQYLLYRSLLSRYEPTRHLVLAIPDEAYDSILTDEVGQTVQEDYKLTLLVFDPKQETIKKWLK
jgi:hypothetical protein